MSDDPRGRPPYGDWTVPADQLPTAPLYVQIGRMPYDTAGTMVDDASVWNQARLEPLRSQIVPADGLSRLMPVDAYPAVLVADQYRADGHVVRTWFTRTDQPPPLNADGFPAEPPQTEGQFRDAYRRQARRATTDWRGALPRKDARP